MFTFETLLSAIAAAAIMFTSLAPSANAAEPTTAESKQTPIWQTQAFADAALAAWSAAPASKADSRHVINQASQQIQANARFYLHPAHGNPGQAPVPSHAPSLATRSIVDDAS